MRIKEPEIYHNLDQKLTQFSRYGDLPGINLRSNKEALLLQLVDSIRRIKYIKVLNEKEYSSEVSDASIASFNPIKASIYHLQNDNYDEACWLVFLITNFSKHYKTEWNLLRNFYLGLGNRNKWTWEYITNNLEEFHYWIDSNHERLSKTGNFGNHRKYQTVNPNKGTGRTDKAVQTYIDWIEYNSHDYFFSEKVKESRINSQNLFNNLYKSMNEVYSFGRTAKFDYLTMIGKIGLLDIVPDKTYMAGATGPYKGAKILFGKNGTPNQLEIWLRDLEDFLDLEYGMQVLEDAICNWQKDPSTYKYFRG